MSIEFIPPGAGLRESLQTYPAIPAFESWTAEPTEPDPAFLEAAVEQYINDPIHGEFAEEMARLAESPVLHDQRGPDGAAFLWVGAGSEAETFVFRTHAGDLFSHGGGSGIGWGEHDEALMLTSTQRGPPAIVSGLVDPAAAAVEIETESGRLVQATVGHGRFLAWWPGTEPSTRLLALTADGTVIAEIEGCCPDEAWSLDDPPEGSRSRPSPGESRMSRPGLRPSASPVSSSSSSPSPRTCCASSATAPTMSWAHGYRTSRSSPMAASG